MDSSLLDNVRHDDGEQSLSHLAVEINDSHQQAHAAAKSAIAFAYRCGELLLNAKVQLKHGDFGRWIAENCQVGQRQARNYMRLAEGRSAIEGKTAPSAELSIKGALKLLQDDHVDRGDDHGDRGNTTVVSQNDAYGLPDEIPAGCSIRALHGDDRSGDYGRDIVEVIPHEQLGFAYVAFYRDLDSDNADVVFSGRGIAFDHVGTVLQLLGVDAANLTEWIASPRWEVGKPWFITAKGMPAAFRGQ